MSKEKYFIEGVSSGVFSFLHDRPISVVDPMIEEISNKCAVKVLEWMEDHSDEIISAIAKAAQKHK